MHTNLCDPCRHFETMHECKYVLPLYHTAHCVCASSRCAKQDQLLQMNRATRSVEILSTAAQQYETCILCGSCKLLPTRFSPRCAFIIALLKIYCYKSVRERISRTGDWSAFGKVTSKNAVAHVFRTRCRLRRREFV